MSPEKAIATLQERSGTWFDPEIVRIAVSLDRQGTLWTNCSYRDPEEATRQAVLDLDQGTQHKLNADQVDQICEAFADVVDAKSHFTFPALDWGGGCGSGDCGDDGSAGRAGAVGSACGAAA